MLDPLTLDNLMPCSQQKLKSLNALCNVVALVLLVAELIWACCTYQTRWKFSSCGLPITACSPDGSTFADGTPFRNGEKEFLQSVDAFLPYLVAFLVSISVVTVIDHFRLQQLKKIYHDLLIDSEEALYACRLEYLARAHPPTSDGDSPD